MAPALGSCFCRNIQVEYTGQPYKTALCHCYDCRKLTGSLYTYSFVVKRSELKVSGPGTPKEVAKTADSGNHINNYFCPDCGTLLFGWRVDASGEPTDEIVILRAGILDDPRYLDGFKPEAEVYTCGRLKWVEEVGNAEQFLTMPAPAVLGR
ncbi:Mss4-like protein [Aspergillus californicus]